MKEKLMFLALFLLFGCGNPEKKVVSEVAINNDFNTRDESKFLVLAIEKQANQYMTFYKCRKDFIVKFDSHDQGDLHRSGEKALAYVRRDTLIICASSISQDAIWHELGHLIKKDTNFINNGELLSMGNRIIGFYGFNVLVKNRAGKIGKFTLIEEGLCEFLAWKFCRDKGLKSYTLVSNFHYSNIGSLTIKALREQPIDKIISWLEKGDVISLTKIFKVKNVNELMTIFQTEYDKKS
jgi:hypothetical protein